MDFDIEDGSFYNWDGGSSGGSYDFSFLDDLIPSGGVNPSSFDTSFLDDFDFGSMLGGFDFSTILGDQEGDFDLGGSYGNPLAPGLKDAVDDLFARNVLNDPFSTYDSPEDFSFSGSYGDPLAPGVQDAVENLFKYNAAIAEGGYPTIDKDGNVVVKDNSGKDLFKVDKDGNIKDRSIFKDAINKLTGNKDNAAMLAALLAGLMGLNKNKGQGVTARGYQNVSKPLTATRQALSPAGAPGSGGGRRFLSDVTYAAEGGLMDNMGYPPGESVLFMSKGGIPSLQEYRAMGKGLRVGDLNKADTLVRSGMSPKDALDYYDQVPDNMATGGLSSLGSYSDGGRMLKGPGDGMSDSIPATISGKRPARLADGEFVVPADVVSGLGNGSTDAGAKVLYEMMDNVRKARTGTKKQGKQINPKKYTPK